jgi:hypothetical protein
MATATIERSARGAEFDRLGFYVSRGLIDRREIDAINDTFMTMHHQGGVPGLYEPKPEGHNDGFHHTFTKGDPLAHYPRVMQPHRFMPLPMKYLLDPRILDTLKDIAGEEMLAAQTMFYFKPAGARGQAWHQDNFYLQVAPGTCFAAWIACDRCDEENGALNIVVKTHTMDVVCPTKSADPGISFTKELVTIDQILQTRGGSYGTNAAAIPESIDVAKPILEPGDVLFFNGSVVHGSGPNSSKTRFRRSLINHYMGESGLEISGGYHPLLNRKGEVVSRGKTEGGGVCGTEHSENH